MKRQLQLLLSFSIVAVLQGQTLDPALLLKPLGTSDAWPTYSGDYSGKRYSALTQLNQSNVKNLTLAWSSRLIAGSAGRKPGPNLIAVEVLDRGVESFFDMSVLAELPFQRCQRPRFSGTWFHCRRMSPRHGSMTTTFC